MKNGSQNGPGMYQELQASSFKGGDDIEIFIDVVEHKRHLLKPYFQEAGQAKHA